jgi:hypothetical protein
VKAVVSYTRMWGLRCEVFNYYTCKSNHWILFTKCNKIHFMNFKHNLFIFNTTRILKYITMRTHMYILHNPNLFRNNLTELCTLALLKLRCFCVSEFNNKTSLYNILEKRVTILVKEWLLYLHGHCLGNHVVFKYFCIREELKYFQCQCHKKN